jgi:hypothetical protein
MKNNLASVAYPVFEHLGLRTHLPAHQGLLCLLLSQLLLKIEQRQSKCWETGSSISETTVYPYLQNFKHIKDGL